MGTRKPDRAIDAFSASRSLLHAAQTEAKRRRMTKSGFYRYCLAKALKYEEDECMRFAEHASAATFNVIEETETAKVAEDSASPSPAQSQESPRKPVIYEKAKRKTKGTL